MKTTGANKEARSVSSPFEKIAFVKTGWASEYRGEEVAGRHGHIKEHHDAHERFNFMEGPDGSFYGYVPPVAGSVPKPTVRDGWLVIFVAPWYGKGHLVPVGWYTDASFEKSELPRPEYESADPIGFDSRNQKYVYVVRSDKARLIPVEERRRITVPGRPHFGQTSILYARGYGKPASWRNDYATLAERIVISFGGSTTSTTPVQLTGGFASPEHSRAVEKASVKAVWTLLESDYEIDDRQKDNCGYDLLAKHKKDGSELHVEVKGTSMTKPHFFMTPNEKRYMESEPRWRMGMVTSALDEPVVKVMTRVEVETLFDIEPRAWEGKLRS